MSPATLRIELFPTSLPRAIDFYTRVMSFELLRNEPDPQNSELGYTHLARDTIHLGLATTADSSYPTAVQDPANRAQFRTWPTGVELVIEVDDLQAERDRIVSAKWTLDADLERQPWGLTDFRISDPDGYYLRITERGTRDGRGLLVRESERSADA